MGQNRDLVLTQCTPDKELGFATAEYESRLQTLHPRMAGITYYICTLLLKQDSALLPVQTPRRLTVID